MFIPLAVAILPALLLVYLFKKWDEKRPEPPGMVRNAVIFGMLSCIPAAIIEVIVMKVLGKGLVEAQGQAVNSFVIAACTEEGIKLSIVMLYFWRKQDFNEVMDGILYTAATSLGFALLENIMYAGGNLITGIARAISAVPLHATASGIMGYFVGRAKMNGGAFGRIATGYLCAVMIHGVYDWACFSGGKFGFGEPEPLLGFGIAVGIVVSMGLVLRKLVKAALAEDDRLLGPQARPLPGTVPYHIMMNPAFAAQYGYAGYGPQPYGYGQPAPGYGYGPPPQPAWQPLGAPQPYPQAPYPQQQAAWGPQVPYQQPYPQQAPPPQQGPGVPGPNWGPPNAPPQGGQGSPGQGGWGQGQGGGGWSPPR